jgi:hypothetical protein
MGLSFGRRGACWCFLAAVAVVVMAALSDGCGSDEVSTSTTAATVASSLTGTSGTAGSESSTSISGGVTTSGAVTSTTAEATTTTAKATTTTAKATTTTAKATTTTAKATTTSAKPTTTTAKAKVTLTVTGPSGTEELSMADLKAMSVTSGYGGWKNQLGNITGPVLWKGVSLSKLMDLVGGGSSVVVIASDGYEQSLTAGEVSGGVTAYDPGTGEEISSISGNIRAILAYSKGGGAIGSGEGPLRIAFVSPEKDQVTDSAMWVKMVVSIRVN